MFHLNKLRLLSLAALLVAFPPFHQRAKAQQSVPELFGKTWTLTEIEGRKASGDKPNIQFDRDQKRVSGSGGCNRFSGAFEIQDSSMRFSRTISTKMACVDVDLQHVETRFLSSLDSITRYEVAENTLRLYANDRLVLVLSTERRIRSPHLSVALGS